MDKKFLIGGGLLFGALVYLGMRKKSGTEAASMTGGPATAIRGNEVHLIKDRYYAGRMHVTKASPTPFTEGAGADVISKGLKSLGFDDVVVYMSAKDVPQDLAYLTDAADENCRFFKAKWPNLTSDMPKPESMVRLNISKPPQLGA